MNQDNLTSSVLRDNMLKAFQSDHWNSEQREIFSKMAFHLGQTKVQDLLELWKRLGEKFILEEDLTILDTIPNLIFAFSEF